MRNRYKIKSVPQPLVFCFSGLPDLLAALAEACWPVPRCEAGVCRYGGRWVLALWCPLGRRMAVLNAAAPFGEYLGPCPVRYAYWAEHGFEVFRGTVKMSKFGAP